MASPQRPAAPQDDVWIPTFCGLCYNLCSLRVHRVNGVALKIEGNPDSPLGEGRLCPRGSAGLMTLYDPCRLTKPLKRGNPEKGIGVDPRWQEISWEEALDLVVERLAAIHQEDPRQLLIASTVARGGGGVNFERYFGQAFGTPNSYSSGAGTHCGNGEHLLGSLLHAAWNKIPDYDHCNYLMLFGCHAGFAAYYALPTLAHRTAQARVRGMRVVVIDPMCNAAAAKANEWVPIRVGTDAALALALANLLVNELGLFDAEHLKHHTNAPYLIGEDGYYLRDTTSGKPLVWDAQAGGATTYDAPGIGDFALDGTYDVSGRPGRPAFALLKEHLRAYTPERAAEITTVPATTIRRLAREFGEAACIGSKIVIQGHELPYRPVAVVYFTGAQGHKHSLLTSMSLDLLNGLVGAADVPGGVLGTNPVCHGYPATGRPFYAPSAGPDGLMVPGMWMQGLHPYPPRHPERPRTMSLVELHPLSAGGTYLPVLTTPDPQKWGLDYRIKAMLIVGSNVAMSLGHPQTVVDAFKHIPFIVSFNLNVNETADALADLVLPDACYLERYDLYPFKHFHQSQPGGMGRWGIQLRQPVVEPPPGVPNAQELFLELAERLRILPELYMALNQELQLQPPYRLDLEGRYSFQDILDHYYKSLLGPEHGLDWFREHGVLTWPKQVAEVYWKSFQPVRVPIYFEFFKKAGEEVKRLTQEMGLEWDVSDYQPLPDWKPCPSHEVTTPGYDFYAFYYRVAWHTFSWTMQNAWLNEVAEADPWSYFVVINAHSAAKKGIRDGAEVWIESIEGTRIKGRARLSRAIHPEALGIASNAGHWSDGLPLARGKGARICELQPISMKYTDYPTNNLDLCVKVKAYPA